MTTPDHEALLKQVATALTACHVAGIPLRLKHNTVYAERGYVLPTEDGWVVRTLTFLPFEPED